MATPATYTDVARPWCPLSSPEEQAAARNLLDEAWLILRTRMTTLESRMVDDTLLTENVTRVLANMARRVLMNPEGWVQEAIDDWRGRRDDVLAAGILEPTAAEVADLSPRSAVGSFTILPGGLA